VVDEKAPPKKQGLHGWKAAFAVFGCGTLAAFGVFGILVGLVGFFLDSVANGVDAPRENPVVAEPGEPIADLKPGELNLCKDDVQYAYNMSDPNYESGKYEDPAISGGDGDRIVSDECEWDVTPQGGDGSSLEDWKLLYSYEAIVDLDGRSRDDVASQGFDALVEEVSAVQGVINTGETNQSDRSFFSYGKTEGGDYFYYLIGQTRSTVYMIHYTSPSGNGEVSQNRFEGEATRVASFVEPGLEILIPE
jgi:hypothetical protein